MCQRSLIRNFVNRTYLKPKVNLCTTMSKNMNVVLVGITDLLLSCNDFKNSRSLVLCSDSVEGHTYKISLKWVVVKYRGTLPTIDLQKLLFPLCELIKYLKTVLWKILKIAKLLRLVPPLLLYRGPLTLDPLREMWWGPLRKTLFFSTSSSK